MPLHWSPAARTNWLTEEETAMANDRIQIGYEVFVSDVNKPFGAVRQVSPHGRPSWSFIANGTTRSEMMRSFPGQLTLI
jgi:hypothetical protein